MEKHDILGIGIILVGGVFLLRMLPFVSWSPAPDAGRTYLAIGIALLALGTYQAWSQRAWKVLFVCGLSLAGVLYLINL